VVCLLAAPHIRLFASVGDGRPHNAQRYDYLMPISCHFRHCNSCKQCCIKYRTLLFLPFTSWTYNATQWASDWRCWLQSTDVSVPGEADDDSNGAAADVSASVNPGSRLESDALRKFQKKATSPLNTKRCSSLVYVDQRLIAGYSVFFFLQWSARSAGLSKSLLNTRQTLLSSAAFFRSVLIYISYQVVYHL